jgi:bifunctional oligoribonuclease and PAP phosphatase NrnA
MMIRRIISEIEAHRSFLITTHENPDGDAIGSTMALGCFLRSLGKDVTIYYCDPLPDNYLFLPLAGSVVQTIPDRFFDVCFVLDAGELKRAGEAFVDFRGKGKIINIDHHPYGELFGDINLVDQKASATGAIIYRIMKGAGHTLDYDTALCVYTAIVTDTGSFRYSNADPEAFRISAELVELGINPWFIAEKLYESQPRKRLELLALALATLTVSERGVFASVTVTLDMYEKTGAGADLTDGFVNYPRSIHGVEVAALFREVRYGLFKVSFRSKGKVNVSALAAAFGGGGHHNAAGCTVNGSVDEVKKVVFSHLENAL